jgi:hypothetical protein
MALLGPGTDRAMPDTPMPSSPSPVLDEIRSVPQRGTRASTKPLPTPPPALAIRIPVRLAGLMLLAVVAICLAALASGIGTAVSSALV